MYLTTIKDYIFIEKMIEDNLFLAKTAQFELQTAIQFFDVKPKLYKDKIFPNIMHKIYFKHNNEIF